MFVPTLQQCLITPIQLWSIIIDINWRTCSADLTYSYEQHVSAYTESYLKNMAPWKVCGHCMTLKLTSKFWSTSGLTPSGAVTSGSGFHGTYWTEIYGILWPQPPGILDLRGTIGFQRLPTLQACHGRCSRSGWGGTRTNTWSMVEANCGWSLGWSWLCSWEIQLLTTSLVTSPRIFLENVSAVYDGSWSRILGVAFHGWRVSGRNQPLSMIANNPGFSHDPPWCYHLLS